MEDSLLCVGLIDCFLTFLTRPNNSLSGKPWLTFSTPLYFFLSPRTTRPVSEVNCCFPPYLAHISTAQVSSYTLSRKWPWIHMSDFLEKPAQL
ncbi:hypothetical protein Q7C36_017441 [Tachysurus vachellii]|uniref:Uncharacterized protein n=1 Tax=Tachysurus vachellii TaxID=175792 RepID=A0AA88SEV5_TACVA|nr:hypothetical protein Q7C36_017441 [Tachysurus vachellii]